ncbi:MAG: hypothetical protein WCF04_00305 [Candidatus Nanopelagicales bacterium]
MGVTYEAAREVLQACDDRRWLGSGFGDPHCWRRALLGAALSPAALFAAGVAMGAGVDGVGPYLAGVLLLVAVPVLVELHALVRARWVVSRAGAGIPGRYVLARDWWDHPCVVLFPPEGDEAPWGSVGLLDSRGGAPLAGDVTLVGGIDPLTGRPQVGSVVVPKLSTGPLWPIGALRAVQVNEGQLIVEGVALRPVPSGADRAGGSSGDA